MAKTSNRSGKAPSQRQLRVGELIRRKLADMLNRGEIHDPDLNRMSITVGEVRVSPDLHIATIYVLPLGGQGKDEALKALRKNLYEIRRTLARGLGLKHAPELRFRSDNTFDQMAETERLLGDAQVQADVAAKPDDDE